MNISKSKSILLLGIGAMLLMANTFAWTAENCYMRVTGKAQGEIRGDCKMGGDKRDTIVVYGVDHEIEVPYDRATGLSTGHRIHHPLTIVKHIGPSSPKLYQACTRGEQLDIRINYYRLRPDGSEELYYRIHLEQAMITNIKHVKLNTNDSSLQQYPDMEEVSFTYAKITWTYTDGYIEHTDQLMDR